MFSAEPLSHARIIPLCLADRKHKLFWFDTRELEQKTRLNLVLSVTRNPKE